MEKRVAAQRLPDQPLMGCSKGPTHPEPSHECRRTRSIPGRSHRRDFRRRAVRAGGRTTRLPAAGLDRSPTRFQPTHLFEDGEFAALVESVKARGILQAIWVRPHENYDPGRPRFWLIAGERRWRAAHAAGLSCIPVTVRIADARQALILAELENNPALRINLSVAEEAQFAQRFLGECDGDRAEAARLLGWSRGRLDARLLLLHAAPAVLEALKQRHIQVGHAELLAGLPEATQTGTLAKIVGDRITVADLKARIKGFALDLSAAIFDKTECATCPHHSSQQAALFAEAVEVDAARTGRVITRKPKPRWWPARPNWKPCIPRYSSTPNARRTVTRYCPRAVPKGSVRANSSPARVAAPSPRACPASPVGKVSYKRHCASTWTATARKWPPRTRSPPVAHPPPRQRRRRPPGAPSRQRPPSPK